MKIVTTEDHDGTIKAYSLEDDWKNGLETAHCWVWQDQPNKETAITRHTEAYEAWETDNDSGSEFKEVY